MTREFIFRDCARCGGTFGSENFLPTESPFFPDGHLSICTTCLEKMVREHHDDWNFLDKLCRWADLPFYVDKWTKMYETNGPKTFRIYSRVYSKKNPENIIDWKTMNDEYLKLLEKGELENRVGAIDEKKRKLLQEKWGENYLDQELNYLEKLYNGLLATQNIAGDLQLDQAVKLCKLSLIIDNKIRAGEDFDKILSSYDKLTKVAGFTPKNVKNEKNFESAGELFAFLEKRGFMNNFYNGEVKDEVDLCMKNIQNWVRKLYINESSIPEDIEKRIEGLKTVQQLEHDEILDDDPDVNGDYSSDFDDIEIEDFNPEV